MHAWTVLGKYTLSNGTRLLKIRNPWNTEKYFGDWSDDSPLWTPEFEREVGKTDADDGEWFISVEDYYQ